MCEFNGLHCFSKIFVKSHEKLHKIASQIHNYSFSEVTGLEIIEEVSIDNNIEINNEISDKNDKITK
jgi:hypothetical protein